MISWQKILKKKPELIEKSLHFVPSVIEQPSSASRKSTTNAMMQDLFVASTSRPASRAASAAASRRNSIGSANSAEMAADAAYNQELNHGKFIICWTFFWKDLCDYLKIFVSSEPANAQVNVEPWSDRELQAGSGWQRSPRRTWPWWGLQRTF